MKPKNIIFIFSLIFLFTGSTVFAQDGKKDGKPKRVRLKLEYLKQTDGTKVLKSKLNWKDGKKFKPAVGQNVTFYAEGDTTKVTLGTIQSDEEGFATLYIEKGVKFPVNTEGFTTFSAKMKKSKKFKKAGRSIEIKDANLDVSFDVEDSVKTIDVKVTMLSPEGETVPAPNTEIYVYVKRLYSLLKIANGVTDENGKYKTTFPDDIPGDSIGNVKIIVKVLESDDFGTIEHAEDVQWGTVVSYAQEDLPRALWTGEAPLWMVIATLIILLGAWFNFLLAVYKVYKIKKTT